MLVGKMVKFSKICLYIPMYMGFTYTFVSKKISCYLKKIDFPKFLMEGQKYPAENSIEIS